MAEGLFAEAVAYYRRADELSTGENVAADLRVFEAMTRGVPSKLFDGGDLTAQADAIFADDATTSMDRMRVLYGMQKAAYYTGEKNAHLPYLKAAYELSEGDADEYVQKKRTGLKADYLLHVEEPTEEGGGSQAGRDARGVERQRQPAEQFRVVVLRERDQPR